MEEDEEEVEIAVAEAAATEAAKMPDFFMTWLTSLVQKKMLVWMNLVECREDCKCSANSGRYRGSGGESGGRSR